MSLNFFPSGTTEAEREKRRAAASERRMSPSGMQGERATRLADLEYAHPPMPSEPKDVAGLTAVRVESLRRVPLRTRGSSVTRAGWRLELTCTQGAGAIVVAEVDARETWHRGEGILLGWPQEALAQVHAALTGHEEEETTSPQLG